MIVQKIYIESQTSAVEPHLPVQTPVHICMLNYHIAITDVSARVLRLKYADWHLYIYTVSCLVPPAGRYTQKVPIFQGVDK